MELRLLALLCELPDAKQEDFAALKAIYERLPEGFSTVVVSRARELLQRASL
jgi:hypothetical protein